MNIEKLTERFEKEFKEGSARIFFSPSRINLIGEHIDYNGGSVFPCAIEIGTYAAVSKREDDIISLVSTNFEYKGSFEISENLVYEEEKEWMNYAMGMCVSLLKKGHRVGGMNILVSGNIPNGAGLSSSASLELLIGEIINVLYNDGKIDRIELVKAGKETENQFIGLQSGIMDQFIIGMGKKGHAILLNTETLDYEYIPISLGEYRFVVMNTKKRRELKDSKYNERRSQCEAALERLGKARTLTHLCELSMEEFEELSYLIGDEVLTKRARHVVSENIRVKDFIGAISRNDMVKMGELLNDSHRSLKEDYEVTGVELDTLVTLAQRSAGCIGARMTGAGFGGCAIALVKKDEIDLFISQVGSQYEEKIGYAAEFFISDIDDGVRELR